MKATFPDGTVFEGTTEEYLAIRDHSTHAGNGNKTTPKPTNGSEGWNEKRARAFWEYLDVWHNGGRQKKLLRFLLDNGGRATEDDVWKHLGVKKGQELAGVLANITRNARRETKNENAKVVGWMRDARGISYYYILEDILQFLKQIA